MLRECICKQCGSAFKGGPRAWYCPDCRIQRRRDAVHKSRRYGTQRSLGSADRCMVCNKVYVVNSGQQKYCPTCAPAAVKAVDREQGLDYYAKNKGAINPLRNKARRKPIAICEICGNEFDQQGTRQNTCSAECKRKRVNKKWLERYHAKKQAPKASTSEACFL